MEHFINQFWIQHRYEYLRFIRKKVSDQQTAEDIWQDLYVKISQKAPLIKDKTKIRSWAYMIVRNMIIDFYRKERPSLPVQEQLKYDNGSAGHPYQILQDSVLEMIRNLPEKYSTALLMAEYQGLSQKEMANKLGISLAGVKFRMQRARLLLKEAYLNCCHFECHHNGISEEYNQQWTCC